MKSMTSPNEKFIHLSSHKSSGYTANHKMQFLGKTNEIFLSKNSKFKHIHLNCVEYLVRVSATMQKSYSVLLSLRAMDCEVYKLQTRVEIQDLWQYCTPSNKSNPERFYFCLFLVYSKVGGLFQVVAVGLTEIIPSLFPQQPKWNDPETTSIPQSLKAHLLPSGRRFPGVQFQSVPLLCQRQIRLLAILCSNDNSALRQTTYSQGKTINFNHHMCSPTAIDSHRSSSDNLYKNTKACQKTIECV